eukprot:gene8477-13076_t
MRAAPAARLATAAFVRFASPWHQGRGAPPRQQPFPRQQRFNSSRAQTVLRGPSSDPWRILGVSREASDQDVKKAYIKLAKEYHPDKTGGDDKMFKKVKEAYDMIRSGEATKFYPTGAGPTPNPGAATGNYNTRWSGSYGGFPNQGQDGHNPFENAQFSSSQTTYDRFGGEETTYTYRDATGRTFSYSERKEGGDANFWNVFRQAQQEALRQETDRMRARAKDNAQYQKIFEDWAAHKINDTLEYQDYVQSRDRAFYRFIVVWFFTFLALRLLINIFV